MKIFIGLAWPYANGPLHLGHIAGVYLPADIFARYHRIKGNEVLMVSGSDQHGTPVTIKADQEGKSPEDIALYYHEMFIRCFKELGISFDIYTRTGTENHKAVVHDMFLRLLEKGFIYKDLMISPYCEGCRRFLPDRYVRGRCPYCGFDDARGDQCDSCGKPLDPEILLDLRCRICGGVPALRETEHFFLDLPRFQEPLLSWVEAQGHWRPNVRNFTLNLLRQGLKSRAITRDIDWGVPIPVKGFESKRIYVWFEAVIGYLSASKEWAISIGDPDKWKEWWMDEDARSYYFIGKDNIPFHTIIWPAMLMGYGGLNLPYDVPANEFLTLEGRQFSTSRNWAVWVPDYLEEYEPDPLRYVLSSILPETRDSDFSWKDFLRRNNLELVGNYGNLVHRVLSFAFRVFEGRIPTPSSFDPEDLELLNACEEAFEKVGALIEGCRFKEALSKAMELVHIGNRYVDRMAPWDLAKKEMKRCSTVIYTLLCLIDSLKILLYIFMPFSSQKIHHFLGYDGSVEGCKWEMSRPPYGMAMRPPTPLFKRLDQEIVEKEMRKLGRV